MNCDDARQLIKQYIREPDDELGRQVNAHVSECEDCLRYLSVAYALYSPEMDNDAVLEALIQQLMNQPPAERMANLIMHRSILDETDMVYLIPEGEVVNILYNVNGDLQTVSVLRNEVAMPLMGAFKIIAGISPDDQHQSGQFEIYMQGKTYLYQLNVLAVPQGEAIEIKLVY